MCQMLLCCQQQQEESKYLCRVKVHHSRSHLCILGIELPLLRGDRVNVVALKQAQCSGQQTGIVVEDDSQQRDQQPALQLC